MNFFKLISTMLLITVIISLISLPVYADSTPQSTETSILDSLFGASKFVNKGKEGSKDEIVQIDNDTTTLVNAFGSIMIAGGIIVVLIMSLIVGVQYMMASVSGEAEKKAQHKKALIILVLAIFLLTSANFVFKFVVKSINDLKFEEMSY